MRSSSFDFTAGLNAIDKIKKMSRQDLKFNELILLKIDKIILQANTSFCAEQILTIIVEALSLKYDHKIDIEKMAGINIHDLVLCVLPLFEREQNKLLTNYFEAIIDRYNKNQCEEKYFFDEIKSLYSKHISCLDLDFVMQRAKELAKSSKELVKRNAMLVVGRTGAGKSLAINYICCEEIFSRPLLSRGKLEINLKKQPDFLKNIKIGQTAVSATLSMNVIDVANSKSKWMSQYNQNKYVICDTPGAGDNRECGPELKLANALETILPLHVANSIRFLVLISSEATGERGRALKETIQYIASMFRNKEDLHNAASSMVFAISGDGGETKVAEFIRLLNDFYSSSTSLGLSEMDVKLVKILKQKFSSKEICYLQPGKSIGISAKDLMGKLDTCQPLAPEKLISYAERDIKKYLETESTFLTKSIDSIFASLENENNLSIDVMQSQINRLNAKFAKLCFMDEYYSINQSNLLPYFKKLSNLMGNLKTRMIADLCPRDRAIDQEKLVSTKVTLACLSQLDQVVNMMIDERLKYSRERIVALLSAFNGSVESFEKLKEISEKEWVGWLEMHRPSESVLEIESAIHRHRSFLTNKLSRLINLPFEQIYADKLVSLHKAIPPQNVPLAQTVCIDKAHQVFIKHDYIYQAA